MAWQWTPFTPVMVVTTGAFVCLSIYAWYRRRRISPDPTVWKAFLGLSLSGVLWSAGYVMQLSSVAFLTKLSWTILRWIGVLGAHYSWIVLVVAYVGKNEWLTRKHLAALAVVPTVWMPYMLANWRSPLVADLALDTSNQYVLLVVDRGPLLLALYGYIYVLNLGTYVLLGRLVARSDGIHRRQAATILAAGGSITLASWATLAGLSPVEHVDLTPLSLLLTSALIAWALVRYRFLDLPPVAKDVALDAWGDGLLVLDSRERVVDANQTGLALCGAERAEDLIGQPAATALDPVPALRDALRSGTDRVELTVEREDERRFYEAILSRRGEVTELPGGTVVVLRDITIQRDRERELAAERKRLEEFAAVVSHDLRNPLTVAAGQAELLADRVEDDADAREALERHRRACDRMEGIIDDLLTLARHGADVGETEPTDVGTVARRAWETVETGNATLTVAGTPTVESDPRRLREAFENLFRNAVEHGSPDASSAAGPERVDCQPSTDRPDGAGEFPTAADDPDQGPSGNGTSTDPLHVEVGQMADGFYVQDDGRGVPPSERPRIFERGYSTSDGGTGLGLAIVRRIAAAHGWEVRLAENGVGARFEFRTTGSTGSDGPESGS